MGFSGATGVDAVADDHVLCGALRAPLSKTARPFVLSTKVTFPWASSVAQTASTFSVWLPLLSSPVTVKLP
jgi:hypothetical protein